MENEKFKKLAVVGICLFFMVGISGCTEKSFAIGIAIIASMAFIGRILIFIAITFVLFTTTKFLVTKYKLNNILAKILLFLIAILPTLAGVIYYLPPFDLKNKMAEKEKAINEQRYKEATDFWINEISKYKKNLIQACNNEQKLTINQKIPANSGIFWENNNQKVSVKIRSYQSILTSPNYDTANLIEKCKAELNIRSDLPLYVKNNVSLTCINKYGTIANWLKAIIIVKGIIIPDDSIKKYSKASYFETMDAQKIIKYQDNNTSEITSITAPYQLTSTDISSVEDRNKGIRRGLFQLKERNTNKIMSEYVSFDMIPTNHDASLYNCLNLDTATPTENFDFFHNYLTETNYRYFFENAVE